MKVKAFAGAAAAMLALGGGVTLRAEDFKFSFSGVAYDSDTGHLVPGVVSGIIYGLDDNTISLPTLITVTATDDTETAAQFFASPAPFSDEVGADFVGGFTVSSGTVKAVSFSALPTNFDEDPLSTISFNVNGENSAFIRPIFVKNSSGFSGISFTAITSAAPEPAAWILIIIGVGAIGSAMRVALQRGARPRSSLSSVSPER